MSGVRKPRKSRGRGLRATTGCLVCKRRHVKCDEARPRCGPCMKGQRDCVYNQDDAAKDSSTLQPHIHEPLQILVDACENERPEKGPQPPSSFAASPNPHRPRPTLPGHTASPRSPHDFIPSPSTESVGSARHASLSWFELLASDAGKADRNFYLSPQQTVVGSPPDIPGNAFHSTVLQPRTPRERESFQAAAFDHDPELAKRLTSSDLHLLMDEPSSWRTPAPIQLSEQETSVFAHFIRTVSPWLDYFDPSRQMASVLPHLALRNIGLMKALLAVSSRHLSLWNVDQTHQTTEGTGRRAFWKGLIADQRLEKIDRNVAVQYYYETLGYLNKAMHSASYARSPELIATALLISTYEMIDSSNRDWERHLKGVFWIQRCQNNNGESGGLRQAVWWAWLRQDTWVAMRERRRVFTFWRPKKPLSTLQPAELACFAHYLLAQCVNYASREECETKDMQHRLERGNELLYMLQEWQDCLPQEFAPLPTIHQADVFSPIWIHPPAYAAAMQVHSLARILVILHRPSLGNLQDYRAAQRLLSVSLNTICGIARTVSEDDDMGSLMALHCLFGAGMSVSTPHERAELLDLIELFQQRVRWPSESLRKDLELEYQKDALTGFAG
ncbi:hypothetical protein FE257_007453 [Aspergillus nanangensis]|uniref:Zn(2)-C6 fungal-type domain-containing protein n=1 Tax=Aspergillus nanangensis TaxID=2582783 RepID=A0AAD4CN90_ASPNN|nr:hypothetical protein FE257_007453 [Aspergillus nanangensis]